MPLLKDAGTDERPFSQASGYSTKRRSRRSRSGPACGILGSSACKKRLRLARSAINVRAVVLPTSTRADPAFARSHHLRLRLPPLLADALRSAPLPPRFSPSEPLVDTSHAPPPPDTTPRPPRPSRRPRLSLPSRRCARSTSRLVTFFDTRRRRQLDCAPRTRLMELCRPACVCAQMRAQ